MDKRSKQESFIGYLCSSARRKKTIGEKMKSSLSKLSGVIFSGLIVAGCGGGGGSEAPAAAVSAGTAEGLYIGTTSNGRTITGIVLDDGTYYVMYSVPNNPAVIAGAIQGTGTSSNGSFTSTNAKDINLEGAGIINGSVSASYVQRQSLNGSITYTSSPSNTFTSTYSADYELTPTLTALAGTYTGTAASPAGAESATLTVTAGGAITGAGASGCTLTGTVAPRSQGNAYDATITFGGAPCLAANTTVTGGIYFDAASKRAYAVALNAARTDGVIYTGTKP
jgi:hypothetical protein